VALGINYSNRVSCSENSVFMHIVFGSNLNLSSATVKINQQLLITSHLFFICYTLSYSEID